MRVKEKKPITKKRVVRERDITTAFRRMEPRGKVEIDEKTRSLKLDGKGTVRIYPDKTMENIGEFSVEAIVTPSRLKRKQQILDSQDPPVRLVLNPDGQLVGSVHTKDGWESVDTGSRTIAAKETVSIRLIHDAKGELSIEINDRQAGSTQTNPELLATGKQLITVGGEVTGKKYLYHGNIGGVRIRRGAIDGITLDGYRNRSQTMEQDLRKHLKFKGNLEVFLDPDTVDHRFNQIKAILSAAGVEDLSALSRLTIDQPTIIEPNSMMVAPKKSTGLLFDWALLANTIANADEAKARELSASMLPNRNSEVTLQNMNKLQIKEEARNKSGNDFQSSKNIHAKAKLASKAVTEVLSKYTRAENLKAQPFSRAELVSRHLNKPLLSDVIQPAQGIIIKDATLLDDFASDNPDNWPAYQPPIYFHAMITSIPVNTSVIIAGVLDLTNQTLVIEPDVETLYIIAEEVVGDTNAKITWRRPGGSTPARADDPNKNGRSYSGVHTSSNSRNGLPGGDGLDGDPGFAGANAVDAPNLEVWAKRLTAMPDIDLNGEDGIQGGRGQRGGRGGNGAKGATGEWWWFFGVQCWKDPGHGGAGGDGGRGGHGGRGGDGGHGGDVAIGVLEGTLASTVEARAFKIKNQGGDQGDGGLGGSGGLGGYGGPHGNDYKDGELVCGTGQNGANGAQGQPGELGAKGRDGGDGNLRFFEFTEESWNEQLTRPWLYELTPNHIFPGDELIITGTRFADSDRLVIDGFTLSPTINADETISVNVPTTIGGGETEVFLRRFDGDESNRLRLWVKPRLDAIPTTIAPDSIVTLTGRAFMNGAKVLYNGALLDATYDSPTRLQFQVPGTGGVNISETAFTIAVRNPDGNTSNERTATIPRTLDNGFKIGIHDFAFDNFAAGDPSWGTFEDTFGALEVWHEAMDPIFGHPILTAAFYGFYHYFLLGEDNGGLATGFCTSLSTIVLDEYYTGSTDTHARYALDDATRERFTAIHGRLLSRESLIDFHDQGRQGNANVVTAFRRIETSLRDGADRESAQMLFFVPSGAAWDEGYFDMLGDSHCIVPIKIVYPIGHDGTSIDGVTMYCWDCNHPVEEGEAEAHNCRLVFRLTDGEIRFSYFDGGTTPRFTSEDGITLATMTNGKYLLSDHDMPFAGPFGLTRFVVDFLLSPADLLVEDSYGNHTGLEGGAILAEIPNSHPAYLAKNMYLLPPDEAMTRRITGNDNGTYTYHSVLSTGTSVTLEDVSTAVGEEDVLAINADASQIRFTPGASKNCRLNLAKDVAGQLRAIAIEGVASGPAAAMDITVSPDLSVVRVGNRDATTSVNVRVSVMNKTDNSNTTLDRNSVSLPVDHDLLVTTTDWEDLALTVRALPFEV